MARTVPNAMQVCALWLVLLYPLWLDQAGAVERYLEQADPPSGFDDLDNPRTTEVEIWYGGRRRGSALATFTTQWLSFHHPGRVAALLPGLADQDVVAKNLQGKLPAHQELLCRVPQETECGFLNPASLGVIFDAAHFRADVFLAPQLLAVRTLEQARYLGDASSDFSAVQGFSLSLSGARSKDSTDHYSWYGRSVLAVRENHLFTDWNYDKAEHFEMSSFYMERDWQGQELMGGLFGGSSFGLGFTADPQLLGVRLAHSTDTLNSAVTINTTPLIVYLPVRGRVEIYRAGKLLDARLLEAGRQQLDTRGFPQGAYNLTIKVYDGTRLLEERQQLYVKSNALPGRDDPLYFLEIGRPMETVRGQWWPRTGPGWVARGGYNRLLGESTALTVASAVVDSDVLAETEILHLGENVELAAGVMVARHNRTGFYGSAIGSMAGVQLQGRYRELSRRGQGKTGQLLGAGFRTGQLGLATGFERVALELGRDWRREEQDTNTRVSDHLRLEWTLFRDSALELRMTLDTSLTHSDEGRSSQVLASLTLSHHDGPREVNIRQSRQESRSRGQKKLALANRASARWQNVQLAGQKMTLGGYIENQRRQRSAGMDARMAGRWLGGQVAVNRAIPEQGHGVTSYIGSLSTSVLARMDSAAVGGSRLGDSALIVDLQGDGHGLFAIQVNGKTVATGQAGDRVPVVLAPFRDYQVSIKAVGNNFADYENRAQQVTLYPGNVGQVVFSVIQVEPVLGRLVNSQGHPLIGAVLTNSQDQAATDSNGLFQGRMRPSVNRIEVQLADGDQCQAQVPEQQQRRRGVVMLGTLTCL